LDRSLDSQEKSFDGRTVESELATKDDIDNAGWRVPLNPDLPIFWWKNCPTCEQGRLVVLKKIDGSLCLECEECYAVFADPESADRLQRLAEFDVEGTNASKQEIEDAGWGRCTFQESRY